MGSKFLRLFAGSLGVGAERKLDQDLKKESITTGKMCKTGLEVHFKNKPSRKAKRGISIDIRIRINLRMSTLQRAAIVKREI